MPANVVRVSADGANTARGSLVTELGILKDKVTEMRTLIKETATWWEGDTGTAFRDSFERACDYFNNELTRKLEAHADKMVASVNAQINQDSQMAGHIRRH